MRTLKNNKYIFIYYAILLLILAMRTGLSAPNPIFRLAYLAAFLIPLIFKYKDLYLPCIVSFMTVCTYNYAFGYLPYDTSAYLYISIIALVLGTGIASASNIKTNPLYVIILYYLAMINIIYSGNPQDIFYGVATISIGALIGDNRCVNRYNMLNCFAIISLVLSIIYLYNYDSFLESYNQFDGQERSGWTDPNYLSAILGMGVVTSLILLLNERGSIALKLMWAITIGVSFIAQVLMASRGGMLSVSVSIFILIIFSSIRTQYKLLIVIILTVFLVCLYTNDYFDLLIYRLENETGNGGSGRVDIWKLKLFHFKNEGNLIKWFFGLGYEGAFKLGFTGTGYGFHNDFLAIFCGYGIVGLLSFCYLLFIHPFRHIHNKIAVISMVVYLALTCFTLEPISSGRIPFIAFYALILFYSRNKD